MNQKEKALLFNDLHVKGDPLILYNIWDAGSANAVLEAGASGFFVPGLMDENLISEICDLSSLPVNIMMKPGVPSVNKLKQLGVARISHGPFPYLSLMDTLKERAVSELKP